MNQYEGLWTPYSLNPDDMIGNVQLFLRLKDDAVAPIIDRTSVVWANVSYNFASGSIRNQREIDIKTTGSDNVSVKEADFYYLDPKSDSWIFIGTEPSFS